MLLEVFLRLNKGNNLKYEFLESKRQDTTTISGD